MTATPEDENSNVVVKLGDTVIENASSPTWVVGANVITVIVTDRNDSTITKTYTVTVTKS